jgi:hypothetical protein
MYASPVHTASLHLNGNAFTGVIPNELGALTLLTSLALENNELSGAIPNSLGGMQSLGRFQNFVANAIGTSTKALITARPLSFPQCASL